jgi:6-phosphofructokinase 2
LIKITTVTPNPAIDMSTSVITLAPFAKLRCAPALRDPGGGGINVARVVQRLGGEVEAIYPAGGASGQLLRRLLDREGVRSLATAASEDTRQDFTIFEETTKRQYRFVLPGGSLVEREWQECLSVLASVDPRPTFVVASGSLPPGVPNDFFGRVARTARDVDAKVIVDTSGSPLTEALKQRVYLIKPNLREFQQLLGVKFTDDASLVRAGRNLIGQGLVELIALSLGADGALLISADRALRVAGLPIKPVSVVGAGDSFLGAMIWSLTRDDSLEVALKYGVAAGSAALLNPGTELCKPQDVMHLFSQAVATPIAGSAPQ